MALTPVNAHAAWALGGGAQFTNAARSASGIIGDYIFSNGARTAKAAGRAVSAAALAPIARRRILCGAGGVVTLVACGLGVSLLEQIIVAEGWTIDKEKGEIYKNADQLGAIAYFAGYSSSTPTLFPYSTLTAAVNKELDRIKAINPSTYEYRLVPEKITSQIPNITVVGGVIQNTNCGGCYQYRDTKTAGLPWQDGSITYSAKRVGDQTKRPMTDDEIANKITSLPVSNIADIASTPDYEAENHQPAKAAAAAATETTDAPPAECATGMKMDAATQTCVPTGTVETPTEGELPEFCNWVGTTICEWYTDTKPVFQQITDFFTGVRDDPITEKPEKDTKLDFEKDPTAPEVNLNFGGSCPKPRKVPFNLFGSNFEYEFSFDNLCTIASTAKPVLIAISSLTACFIVAGRNEGDE